MRGRLVALLPQGQWRKFSINIASLFSVQVANYLLPLLTVPYVSRVIGPERMGLLNFSMSYNNYFVLLVSFGFDVAIVRLVAANRDDHAYINRLFAQVLSAKLLLLALAACIFFALAIVDSSFRAYLPLHMATCLYCVGVALFPQWLFQGMEDLSRIAMLSLLGKSIITLGVFVLVRQADDFIYQNLIMSSSHVIVSTIALGIAVKRYKLTYQVPGWQSIRQRFREGFTFFLSSINNTLYSSSHVFMLGIFSTSYAVGVFSAGSRLELLLRVFVSMALNQALFPIVANGFGQSQERGLGMVRRIAPVLLTGTALIGVLLFVSAPLAVSLLYGNRFNEAVVVVRILAVLPVLLSMNSLLGMHTMLNLHMDRPYFFITLVGSVIGLSLNYKLIHQYSYVGAAIAWVCTEACVVIAMLGWLIYRRIAIVKLIRLNE
ncbi:putative O-antigen transporter [Fibrella aestuarina BUZ 2]|uniref:Putative O-antigen transporter n=1 Tax=Fibrella aestuarina BUZ 2 TaxID=1166018 RepID=I0K3V8_9BACT|nr:flippase [Fibrella aestuarina]CCG98811.1 putative O-antigen transporter [Fibrella aestuarina BUZ 2]